MRRSIPVILLAVIMVGCGENGPRWPWEKTVPVTPQEKTGGRRSVRKTSTQAAAPDSGTEPAVVSRQSRREEQAGAKDSPGDIEGPTPLVALVGDVSPDKYRRPKVEPPPPESDIASKSKPKLASPPEASLPPQREPELKPTVEPAPTVAPAPGEAKGGIEPRVVSGTTETPTIEIEPKLEPGPTIEPSPRIEPAPKPEKTGLARSKVEPKPTPAPSPAVGRPTVVAASMLQVNDRFITIEDVLQNVRPQFASLPAGMSKGAFRRRAASIIDAEVRTLIQQAMILGEAQNRLTDQQKSQIDAEMESNLQDMVAGVGGSRKKLEESIAAKGTTLKALLEAQRRRLTIRLYLQQKFLPAVAVSRQMLWSYYRRHRSEFSRKKRVQMQLIAAPLDAFIRGGIGQATPAEINQARMEARKLIGRADKRLRNNEDFTRIARELSKGVKASSGGVWPMMSAGNFREEKVEAAAFVLRQGQVSDIIETPTGYYIVKALKVIPAREATFEEAQVSIQERLREEQFNRLVGAYFQRLYRGAAIVQSKQFIRLAVERAAHEHFGK